MFMMAIISTACNPDEGYEFPGNKPGASYEVKDKGEDFAPSPLSL
jgi:hypothetical protein